MTRVVLVGELYYADLSVGGGPMPGGPNGPNHPSQGPGFPTNPIAPGGQPPYPSQGPGFPTHPIAPGGQPPGHWGGSSPHPDQGLPGGQPGIDNTLPPGGEEIPPGALPPPAGYEDQIVVAVYRPDQGWQAKSYDPNLSAGMPLPGTTPEPKG